MRARRRTLLAFLPFLVCAGPPPPATPVPKTLAEETQDAETVRELMRTGVGEYKKGNLETARDSFLKAWAIRPHYAIAASLAEVEMALGQYRSTAEHLEYYLSNLPEELRDKRPAAESQLAEARKHLVTLRVTSDPPDATIYVDGVAVVHDRDLLLEPGPHVLLAELGNAQAKKDLVFTQGETRDVKLQLPLLSAPADAPRPSPAPAAAPAERTSDRPVSVLVGGGALTLVAVGLGVGYSLDASSAQNDADRFADETALIGDPKFVAANAQCAPPDGTPPPPACASLRDSLEHASRSRNIATGALIAGGVLAAGTVVTYFLWPSKEPSAAGRFRVAPWTTGAAHGTTVTVDF